jgi:hypothetical protein
VASGVDGQNLDNLPPSASGNHQIIDFSGVDRGPEIHQTIDTAVSAWPLMGLSVGLGKTLSLPKGMVESRDIGCRRRRIPSVCWHLPC